MGRIERVVEAVTEMLTPNLDFIRDLNNIVLVGDLQFEEGDFIASKEFYVALGLSEVSLRKRANVT